MPSGSAGRRYAQAIFDLAKSENKLEEWSNHLAAIAYTFEQDDVKNFLENPKSGRENKVEFVAKTAGSQISPEALRLAQLLVQRDRQKFAGAISEEYTRLWNRLQGIEIARVTTAVAVTEAEQAHIKDSLTELVGKKVTLEMYVDPNIIGGVVAQVGDTLIDGSVRTRLQNLRKQLA